MASCRPAVLVRLIAVLACFAATPAFPDVLPTGDGSRDFDFRANLVELEASGPGGHFRGLSLRLYNPDTHTWSLNFASSSDGTLTTPAVG